MDRQSAGTHGKLRIVTDAVTHTVTWTNVPADLAAAAPTRTLSAADTARLDKLKALTHAAWKITPMVAMRDDPLPENVIAQIIRPAAATSPPVIVMSRTSARMRVFNDARSVLVGDIVRNPTYVGERTVDLYADGRLLASDGGVHKIELLESGSGDPVALEARSTRQLAKVLLKFDVAPQTMIHGKAARVLRWPE